MGAKPNSSPHASKADIELEERAISPAQGELTLKKKLLAQVHECNRLTAARLTLLNPTHLSLTKILH